MRGSKKKRKSIYEREIEGEGETRIEGKLNIKGNAKFISIR
jgi:hypothetical protein